MEGCIYLITCLVNGKKYVGKWHLPNPNGRFSQHRSSANNGSMFVLHCAIRKHGVENFRFELIRTCPLESCSNLEAYYAEQYGCYTWDPEPGYNMVWCGDKSFIGFKHTPESRLLISECNRRRTITLETRERISISKTGKKLTAEHREKIRLAALGKKRGPYKRKALKESLSPVENGTSTSTTNDICSRVGE